MDLSFLTSDHWVSIHLEFATQGDIEAAKSILRLIASELQKERELGPVSRTFLVDALSAIADQNADAGQALYVKRKPGMKSAQLSPSERFKRDFELAEEVEDLMERGYALRDQARRDRKRRSYKNPGKGAYTLVAERFNVSPSVVQAAHKEHYKSVRYNRLFWDVECLYEYLEDATCAQERQELEAAITQAEAELEALS